MKLLRNFSLTLLLISISHLALASESLNRIVAYVNHDIITQTQLDTQVNIIRNQLRETHTPIPSAATLNKQVLNQLIDQRLQLQRAKDAGITVDNTAINNAIKHIAGLNHMTSTQLRHFVTRQGINYKDYRHTIRNQVLITKLQQAAVGSGINITKAEVDNLLQQANKGHVTKLYHLENILIPVADNPTPAQLSQAKSKALTVLKEVKAGKNFEKLAQTESSGSHALQGGDLGLRPLAELPDVFAKRAAKMTVGQVSGPIHTPNGYHLIKLVAIKQRTQQGGLTAAQAEQMIYSRKYNQAVLTWIQRLRAASYVKILL